jgi:molybdopterin converting factor small subunit
MQQVVVKLTSPLRKFANGQDEVTVQASSVGEALQQLCSKHPALTGRILNTDGHVRDFVNVYLGKRHIKELGGLSAAVTGNGVISIASPFSGG